MQEATGLMKFFQGLAYFDGVVGVLLHVIEVIVLIKLIQAISIYIRKNPKNKCKDNCNCEIKEDSKNSTIHVTDTEIKTEDSAKDSL